MEVRIIKEDLSLIDCGGAYREARADIFVDGSLSLVKQRQSLIFEILSLYLDPLEKSWDLMDELSHIIAESIEQLEPH